MTPLGPSVRPLPLLPWSVMGPLSTLLVIFCATAVRGVVCSSWSSGRVMTWLMPPGSLRPTSHMPPSGWHSTGHVLGIVARFGPVPQTPFVSWPPLLRLLVSRRGLPPGGPALSCLVGEFSLAWGSVRLVPYWQYCTAFVCYMPLWHVGFALGRQLPEQLPGMVH